MESPFSYSLFSLLYFFSFSQYSSPCLQGWYHFPVLSQLAGARKAVYITDPLPCASKRAPRLGQKCVFSRCIISKFQYLPSSLLSAMASTVIDTPSSSGATATAPLEISAWVPEAVAGVYRSSGVTHIFAWQAECLALRCFEDNVNLLVSAPTSAGKTLLAEILLFRCVSFLSGPSPC